MGFIEAGEMDNKNINGVHKVTDSFYEKYNSRIRAIVRRILINAG